VFTARYELRFYAQSIYPLSSSSTHCSCLDNRTKSGDRHKSNDLSKIGQLWIATCFHGFPQYFRLVAAKNICGEGPKFC
jgi:hypothetical protein